MLDDDLSAIHADALAAGLATSCTYAGTAITAVFSEMAQPYIHDQGGEVRRREAQIEVSVASVAAPAKGDAIVVSSGVYAGTWTVVSVDTADDASWTITARLDDRTRAGTGRRLP